MTTNRQVPYSQDAKAHDWDFTLSAKREIASGGGTVPTAVPIPNKSVHAWLQQGAVVVKTIGRQFIQSLQRIIP